MSFIDDKERARQLLAELKQKLQHYKEARQ